MKLRFTPRATANLEEIADYLLHRDPGAAARVRAVIYDSLELLILFPLLGRRQRTEGVRKLVTRRYRYLLYYTIDETTAEIVVLSVKHPAQQREHRDA
jgi:toxin ParE1/3/4